MRRGNLRWRFLAGRREGIGALLSPGDRIRQGIVAGEVPVQNITPVEKQQPRQRQPIAIAQGLLPIPLAGPEVGRWDHPTSAAPSHSTSRSAACRNTPRLVLWQSTSLITASSEVGSLRQ